MRLGFIGTGVIASAVVRGLAGQGHEIRVSARSKARSSQLEAEIPEVQVTGLQEILDQSEVVFLGVMAEAAEAILTDLHFRLDQKVVSFMAGVSLDRVSTLVAPAKAAAVMMPFPGIAQGGSAIMALGDEALLNQIFGTRNTVFTLETAAELEAYLCAQAVLSPVARLTADAADWLGKRVADPAKGEAFLRLLISSNLAVSNSDDLIEALNTPGGFNQRLRLYMEKAGIGEDLARGLDRLEEG